MTANRYGIQFCSASTAGQHSNLDAALLLISNNSSGLFFLKKKKNQVLVIQSIRAVNHNLTQQGHNERHFHLISFINIMKSPSEGKDGKAWGTGGSQRLPLSPALT